MNTSAFVGNIVKFECTADDVTALAYLVNSMTITKVISVGVYESAPVYNGSQISLYLQVVVTRSVTNWPVVCIAYLPDETNESSPPAYIHGRLYCHLLVITVTWLYKVSSGVKRRETRMSRNEIYLY